MIQAHSPPVYFRAGSWAPLSFLINLCCLPIQKKKKKNQYVDNILTGKKGNSKSQELERCIELWDFQEVEYISRRKRICLLTKGCMAPEKIGNTAQ